MSRSGGLKSAIASVADHELARRIERSGGRPSLQNSSTIVSAVAETTTTSISDSSPSSSSSFEKFGSAPTDDEIQAILSKESIGLESSLTMLRREFEEFRSSSELIRSDIVKPVVG